MYSLKLLFLRTHLNSDMRDMEFSEWTSKGPASAGFFVATINDLVVGTAAYTVEVNNNTC